MKAELLDILTEPRTVESRGILAERVALWLRLRLSSFEPRTIREYQLDRLARLDFDAYPVERSRVVVQDAVRTLRGMQPTKRQHFAPWLSETLRGCVVIGSGVGCRSCGEGELDFMLDQPTGNLALSCEYCAHAQTMTGDPWVGAPALVPPTREDWLHHPSTYAVAGCAVPGK